MEVELNAAFADRRFRYNLGLCEQLRFFFALIEIRFWGARFASGRVREPE
jgi:hypothetical protein